MATTKKKRDNKPRKTVLNRIEQTQSKGKKPKAGQPAESISRIPSYGDLTILNTSRLIIDCVGPSLLNTIAGYFMELLDTSCAIYEKNGDYALGIFSSCWCQFMDSASRKRCGTPDNRKAFASGKWHCHESCWKEAARYTIENGDFVDIECRGGIRIYAVPIHSGREIIGSISVGYGAPPKNRVKLHKLAAIYDVSVEELSQKARDYKTRPPYLISLAKKIIQSSAQLIGEIVERKQTEKALLLSEEKLRSLVETANDWVWETDQKGIYTYSSAKVRDLLGYEPEEVIGKTQFDFISPTEKERVAAIFQEAQHSFVPMITIEKTNHHKNGQTVELETNAVPIMNSRGEIIGYHGIDRDITQHKLNERQINWFNSLNEELLGRETLNEKLRFITEAVVRIYNADFARIWMIKEGDLCGKSCIHASVIDGPHICSDHSRCLHLVASSGRYIHLDGNHRRVPLGAYKIGNIASGRDAYFLTNDVVHDPNVHNHKWAEDLKLVSFAGFRLISREGQPIGVLVLFKKHPISPEEMKLLEYLTDTVSQIIQAGRAMEVLEESENRFRSLVKNSLDIITVVAVDGTILYESPSLKTILGYEPEDIVGKNVFLYIHPDDAEEVKTAFSNILEHPDASLSVQFRFRHIKGSYISLETVGSNSVNNPNVNGVVLNSRDITERKRVEKAIEKRIIALTQPLDDVESIALEDLFNISDIQHLQDLFAKAWGVAAIITHPDGTPITQPTTFSSLCKDIIRTTPKGLDNCLMSNAIIGRHNPSGPIIQQCLSAGLCNAGASITVGGRHIASWLIGEVRNDAQNEEQIMEYAREIDADETAFREAYRKVPIMSQEQFDKIAHALFALANQLSTTAYQNIQQARFISERTQAKEALHESEIRFKRVVESSPVAISIANQNSEIEYINPMFIEQFGYILKEIPTVEDWFKRAYSDSAEKENAVKRWKTLLNRSADIRNPVLDTEVNLTCKDGSIRQMKILRTSIGNKQLAFFIDLTEHKRIEEERLRMETRMREVQKLESLGILAGGIAHDFNNLLMAILGNADLALLSISPVSPARQHIEEVMHASQRASDLCSQMLAYSGKGRFVVDRYNISEIVREMGQILEVSISKKALIHYSLADGLPAAKVDATQIRQVIMNLITNASESLNDTNGVISIATGVEECGRSYLSKTYLTDNLQEGEYIFIEVSDTGCGMDGETQNKIFDPFYTTKFTGRGLGLAAVLGIVRGHKGAIKVYSEPGKGTTFKILLPAVSWIPGDQKRKTGQEESYHSGGTVLFIDDDENIRNVVSEMLTLIGFQVLTAANGREGLEVFKKNKEKITCVILDLTMPEMGGEETFRGLRKLRSNVYVILSSGFNEQDVSQRFTGLGLAGFIQKPYTVIKLQEVLKQVLG